jgi:microsomal dipeptidase-like Zn-dependent dipeptidase
LYGIFVSKLLILKCFLVNIKSLPLVLLQWDVPGILLRMPKSKGFQLANVCLLVGLGLTLSTLCEARAAETLVDLHAHAFMDRGLGFMFKGDFNGPLRSKNWSDHFSSQINAESLEASGLGLFVVSLYAHPIFAAARRDSIRKQVADAQAFVQTHPDWVIAHNSREAREAYSHGKRIMVLSLEGASGILDTEADIREFVDQDGISIVTFAHLADDKLTGAALMSSYHILGNPRGMLRAAIAHRHDVDGTLLNPRGLTPRGRWVASRLIQHHVWIDLSHATDASADELIPIMRAGGQPLLYTHIGMRDHLHAEREISVARMRQVKESGGILGTVPGESIVGNTPVPLAQCPSECGGNCRGGLFAFAAQFNEVAQLIGADHTFVGTDFSGAQDHLPPTRECPTGTSLDAKGFYNIGQTTEFWKALKFAGAHTQAVEERGIETFITAWEKVYAR